MTQIARVILVALAVSLACRVTHAGALATTPPMGWNSWDAYGTTVREDEVKANADYMAKYLARYGWLYIVVDIEWYTPKIKTHGYIPDSSNVTLDQFGRVVPAVNRFPSAANGSGFTHLAAYVHAKGLKFGIHIMRGIPREAAKRRLPIQGTSFTAADVAATAALVSSLAHAPLPADAVYFGEVSLSGAVRPVAQTMPRLKEAQKLGFTKAIVPEAASNEAPEGFSLSAIGALADLVADIARDGAPARRRAGRQDG